MEPVVKSPPPVSRRPFFLGVAIILIIFIGIFVYSRSQREQGFVSGFVTDPADNLQTTADRTNLALLGFGGDGHIGGDLTDSIIFISLNHLDNSIDLLSIPRDIWIDSLQAKVNTAYHYGEEHRQGGGLDLAKSAVAEITGQPIHYALALDFAGFVSAIDAVGGIEVQVDNSFDDFKYPIPGRENVEPESDRYEHLHFDAGLAHLDGATALKFARSRNSEGDEGTDFARGLRQQKILLAFKDRLLESDTLLDLTVLKNIVNSFRDNLDTDIADGEFGSFFHFFLSFQKAAEPLNSLTLDSYLQTPKNHSPYQGQWVLIPVNTWSEIHDYVAQTLAE